MPAEYTSPYNNMLGGEFFLGKLTDQQVVSNVDFKSSHVQPEKQVAKTSPQHNCREHPNVRALKNTIGRLYRLF